MFNFFKSRVRLLSELNELRKRVAEFEEHSNETQNRGQDLRALAWETLMGFKDLPLEIYIKNSQGEFVDANQTTLKIHGMTKRNLLGKKDDDLPTIPDEELPINHFEEDCVLSHGSRVLERDYSGNDDLGRSKAIRVSKIPIYYNDEIVGLVGFNYDVTEHSEVKENLNRIIKVAPYGILESDRSGNILQSNHFAEEFLGYSKKELLGKSVKEIYHYRTDAVKIARSILTSKDRKVEDVLTNILTSSGEIKEVKINAVETFHVDKKSKTIVGYFRHVGLVNKLESDVQVLEFNVQQQQLLLRNIMDHLPHYLYVKDREGRFQHVNKEAVLRMGMDSYEDLMGKTDYDFYDDYDKRLAEKYRQDEVWVMTNKKVKKNYEEKVIDLRTGEQGTLLTTKVPWIDNETDEVKGIIGIGRDITEMRKILDVGDEFINLKSAQQVIDKASRRIFGVLEGVDWVSIALFDSISQKTSYGSYPEIFEFDDTHIRPKGLSKEICKSENGIVIPDVNNTHYDINPKTLEMEFQSIRGIPIRLPTSEKVIGVLWLHFKKTRHFKEPIHSDVKFYLQQTSLAYDRLQKIHSIQQVERAISTSVNTLGSGDIKGTLKTIVEEINKMVGSQSVILYAYHPETNELDGEPIQVGVKNMSNFSKGAEELSNPFMEKMLQLKEALIIENTLTDHELFHPDIRRFVREEEVTSCAVLPLRDNDENVGVLFVNFKEEHKFEDHEIRNIKILAYLATSSIINHHLNTLQEVVFTNSTHEVQIPFTAIIGDSEELWDKLSSENDKAIDLIALANKAKHNLEEAEKASHVLDTFFKVHAGKVVYEPEYAKKNLYVPISEACDLFRSEANHKKCFIQPLTDRFPAIYMSYIDILRMMKNVIGNAVKYSYFNNDHFIRVKGRWQNSDKRTYLIEIQNYGIGITEEEIRSRRIFQRYRRGFNATDRNRTGGGIGLADAEYVVKTLHKGKINVTSKPVPGGAYLTTFSMYLPVDFRSGSVE